MNDTDFTRPLGRLRASGLTVVLAGDRLIVRPASGLTEHLRAFIRTRWASIVAALLSETIPDDRITCRACANLSGRCCLAAWRREIAASQNYEPVRDLPRRCEGYAFGISTEEMPALSVNTLTEESHDRRT